MRKLAETFRLLFELSPSGIAITDLDGKLLMVNRAFAEMFGYDNPEEILGLPSKKFYILPGNMLLPLMHMAGGTNTVIKYDLNLRRKNGENFFAEVSSRKLRLGRKEYNLTHVHDVNTRIALEHNLRDAIRRMNREKEAREKLSQELREKNAQLEELSRLKDEFLAIASHDLKSPLTSISGYIGVLKENLTRNVLTPEEQTECLNGVVDSVKSLVRLIDSFLDLARIEAGRLTLSLREERVEDIILYAKKTILPVAKQKGIEVEVSTEEPLPSALIDREKFLQVLNNLLSNAVKFTHDDGIIQVVAKADGGGLRIEVRDSGVGIPPDELELIFDKYAQAKKRKRGTRGEKGTGLGLAICRNIVELHRGRIWAENLSDGGSAFVVTLPAMPEEAAPVVDEPAVEVRPEGMLLPRR